MSNDEPIQLRTLPRSQLAFGLVMAGFFPAFVVAMVAFFGDDEPHLTVGIIAAVICILLTALALLWVAKQKIDIEIDGDGIRQDDGGEPVEIAWNEPHNLWIDGVHFVAGGVIPLASHRETTLTTRDGRRIHIGMAASKIHDFVISQSTSHHLQRVLAELEMGSPVSFGPVSLDRHQLQYLDTTHPLDQIEELEIRDGKLRIKLRDKWLTAAGVELKHIPHFPTLHLTFHEVREW